MTRQRSILIVFTVIPLLLVTANFVLGTPHETTTPQQSGQPTEEEARLGQGIQDFRATARQLDVASQKLNRLLDRINGGLDRIETGGLIIRIEMAPAARSAASPQKR